VNQNVHKGLLSLCRQSIHNWTSPLKRIWGKASFKHGVKTMPTLTHRVAWLPWRSLHKTVLPSKIESLNHHAGPPASAHTICLLQCKCKTSFYHYNARHVPLSQQFACVTVIFFLHFCVSLHHLRDVWVLLVGASALDCLERFISNMTCHMSSGMVNPANSLSLYCIQRPTIDISRHHR